ncbi:uncharacterized protein K02A2.6-like [Stegodyphus dumicola]|uniref:uncharacterized protein K02A2.6-like n=1 Tax=Stegodyphus dumicola TaxID=202533 RepID=UPI0015B21D8B|nr:uncharacterized protein K02A2.6-like [Stegodyphus dumicola]
MHSRTGLDRPAYSPDLNPIEHVTDASGLHPPGNTQQLKQMLNEEWALLPHDLLDNLVLSMKRWGEATTAIKGRQIETLPITARDLAKETKIDAELSPLLRILQSGSELKGREMEYSLQDGCIMYGQLVYIPKRYSANVLKELHHEQLGTAKMKAIARSYVFWNDPPKVQVHHWEYPSAPMECIHIDHAGPVFEHMFLIIVNAHSKWLVVYTISLTFKTIECLRDFLARFELPILLVSDNGPQFTSHEFKIFLQSNGIKRKITAPFKPSSNGQAECSELTLQSPAMLKVKREIRTRIDLLRPDLERRVEDEKEPTSLQTEDLEEIEWQ